MEGTLDDDQLAMCTKIGLCFVTQNRDNTIICILLWVNSIREY